MIIDFFFRNKTINQLRKDKGLSARELAVKINVSPSIILRIDKTKLKNIPEPLYQKLYNALEP